MTEIKNSVFLSDTDASIVRLLSGLNFEDFQKQQEFLRSIKRKPGNQSIVTAFWILWTELLIFMKIQQDILLRTGLMQ